MAVHPDKTAHRAVDACGGTYEPEQYANGYAEGHAAALDAAIEAVKKPDALMNELLKALIDVLPYAQAAIGLPRMSWPADSVILKAEAAITKATGEAWPPIILKATGDA